MTSIDDLKKQIEKEKIKLGVQTSMKKYDTEKQSLEKQLKDLRSKNNPYKQKAKKILGGFAKMGSNVVANTEAIQHGVKIGQKVKITNGILTGQKMTIEGFIPGGVKGFVPGHGLAKIRHTSYTLIG